MNALRGHLQTIGWGIMCIIDYIHIVFMYFLNNLEIAN